MPHAHVIVVPRASPDHITSSRFARIEDGRIVCRHDRIPLVERYVLDEQARRLSVGARLDDRDGDAAPD